MLFLHEFKARRGSSGWAGEAKDIFRDEEEGCDVVGVPEDVSVATVADLWKCVRADGEDDEDDGFGSAALKSKAKKNKKVFEKVSAFNLNCISFALHLFSLSLLGNVEFQDGFEDVWRGVYVEDSKLCSGHTLRKA